MPNKILLEEQFVAYSFQKNTIIKTGQEFYFIFFKSKLWTHSAQMNKTEFDGIFQKVSFKKEETIVGKSCIIENYTILNAIARG